MPKRSDTRDAAKKAYVERRSKGEKVNLRELAEQLGANYKTLREWKRKDAWDDAVTEPAASKRKGTRQTPPKDAGPKKKRGGQPGNKNSKGKRNAAGSHKGAPKGNHNAEKDGAYSRVFLDMLPDEELDLIDRTPLEVREALEQEMKILKYRERKILAKIEGYESAEEGKTYLSAVTEIHGKNDTEMRFKDSAFKRVQSLQEALYKVQGRIAKIADSLHALDESAKRWEFERERLEILRMRASGSVEVDDVDAEAVADVETEDAQ